MSHSGMKNLRKNFGKGRAEALACLALAVLLGLGGMSRCTLKNGENAERPGLELVVLHTNDTHSYLAGTDGHGNASLDGTGSSGGLGRAAAAMKAAREGRDNVIAVDAGDQFQGTLFYSVNKWPLIADVDAVVPWDAMTLGNHEFDEGCEELARFVAATPLPVLAANLAPEQGCPLRESRVQSHIVRSVRGEKVGIVGLANDKVATLAAACPHTAFLPAAETLAREVKLLEAEGVKHIVAVTHLGLPEDRELARSVNGVDVIVGGHTHSFLGPAPSDGPYPVVEHSPDGSPVLVVTAGRGARYLGELTVDFDEDGVPRLWRGSAAELTAGMPVDPAVQNLITHYAATLEDLRSEVVGSHALSLPDGMDLCRKEDCLGGMVTTDAMLEYARPFGAEVALCNGGALRAALPAGTITRGDVLSVHPFGNAVLVRAYSGQDLLDALEHGVADERAEGPRLLQVAGLRYEVDARRPVGARVLRAEIIDEKGRARPVDPASSYIVTLSDYLADGGDGYAMLKKGRPVPAPDPLVLDVVTDYLRVHDPLSAPRSGRIVRVR